MRSLSCLFLLTFFLCSAGAQDPVYAGFLLKLSGDPGWSTARSAYLTGQRTRWASALALPELTLSTSASGTASSPGGDYGALVSSPPSWPVSGEITFQIPVVDFQKGARLAALAREESLAGARWSIYRQRSFEAFLGELMDLLELDLLRRSTLRVSGNYRDLAALARRRQTLGAGSARESLLAEMAWKRSQAGQASAERDFQEALSSLGHAAREWLLALPEDTPWFRPQGWPDLLDRWGWTSSLPEDPAGYREPAVFVLEAGTLDWNLAVLGLAEAPQVNFYSLAQIRGLPLQSSLEAGLKLTWRVFSEAGWGGGRISAREALEGRRKVLELERIQSEAAYRHAREAYLGRSSAVKEREEISALAEGYVGILQTGLAAGTGTLEDVLEGWQILSAAQEEELSARWASLKAAVRLLAASGRMMLPEERVP